MRLIVWFRLINSLHNLFIGLFFKISSYFAVGFCRHILFCYFLTVTVMSAYWSVSHNSTFKHKQNFRLKYRHHFMTERFSRLGLFSLIKHRKAYFPHVNVKMAWELSVCLSFLLRSWCVSAVARPMYPPLMRALVNVLQKPVHILKCLLPWRKWSSDLLQSRIL